MDSVPSDPRSALTSVGHAFFSKDGVKLAFGKRWDGRLVHISEVERGASCGCVCPAEDCGRKLVARKPDSNRAHHFSHTPITKEARHSGAMPSCAHGKMTALHMYAQQLLDKKRALVLPPLEAKHGGFSKKIRGAGVFYFDKAILEKKDGETVPDVILFKGEE